MESGGEERQLVSQPRRALRVLQPNFLSQVQPTAGVSYDAQNFGTSGALYLLKASAPASATRMIHTALVECNNEMDPMQRSAYFLSVMIGVFPGLYNIAVETVREMGFDVEVLDENVNPETLVIRDWINVPTALTVFGQLALIPFKNISPQSYDSFVMARTNAIKSAAGFYGSIVPNSQDIFLSMEVAASIKTVVGGSGRFRAALLKMVLANREGESRLNRVCNYLAEIWSWNEMTSMTFVFETLCLTGSPVLKDKRVMQEVFNLCRAFEKVQAHPYPQYYAILNPSDAGVTIIKNRFKTLAEVARKYRQSQSSTVSQFAASGHGESQLVDQLVAKHAAFMLRDPESRMEDAFGYLTNISLDESEGLH